MKLDLDIVEKKMKRSPTAPETPSPGPQSPRVRKVNSYAYHPRNHHHHVALEKRRSRQKEFKDDMFLVSNESFLESDFFEYEASDFDFASPLIIRKNSTVKTKDLESHE